MRSDAKSCKPNLHYLTLPGYESLSF